MPKIADNEIHLWLVDDRQVQDQALLNRYKELLSEQETARHQRFIFTRHRHQYLVTRALVRSILAQYTDEEDPSRLTFVTNANGKPLLETAHSLQFNLSHTNGLVALAVTAENPVGVDVEFLSRKADLVNLAERYFSAGEAGAFQDLPVEEWNTRFFDLWTLKEAYLKACGKGLSTPLNEFSFTFGDGGIRVAFSPNLDEIPAAWKFWQLEMEGGYRLALALHEDRVADYRIVARQGFPLGEFKEISPRLIRTEIR